jgi:acetyltransferase-like isoleucine patch superfamily enzyme
VIDGRVQRLARLGRKGLVGLWLSRNATRPFWELPIVGNLRSRVIRRAGARIEVGQRLYLGDNPTYVGFVARGMAPTVELHQRALLAIEGTARLADGTKILVGPGAAVSIGDGTHFSGDSRVICAESISIGAGCAVAWGVLIMDADFHTIADRATADIPIAVGDHVWIGAGAMILKGVSVGDGAIVAAGAVVTRDVPAGAIAAGNPARIVRESVSWD